MISAIDPPQELVIEVENHIGPRSQKDGLVAADGVWLGPPQGGGGGGKKKGVGGTRRPATC